MEVKDFNETFDYELRDPDFAAAYLAATLEDGLDTFLVALRDVTRAHGGMAGVAAAADLNRESLYRALSEGGNPRVKTLSSVLKALGLQLSVSRAV